MAAAVPEEIPVPIPRMNNYDNIENEELKVAKLNKFLQNRGLHNNLRIFVYTWNTQDVNLSTDEIQQPINFANSPFFTNFREMIAKIQKKRCHMVIFNFQNDQANDRFTKTFLPSIMDDFDYTFPTGKSKSSSTMGSIIAKLTNTKNNKSPSVSEFKPKMGKTMLRTVIFVQKLWWKRLGYIWWNQYKVRAVNKFLSKNSNKIIQQNMANIKQFTRKCNIMDENLLSELTTMDVPTYGKLGIVNVCFKNREIYAKLNQILHKKMEEYKQNKSINRNLKPQEVFPLYESVFEMTRLKIIKEQSKCFKDMIDKAKEERVDYLIVGGDLNYRVKLSKKFRNIPQLLESFEYQYGRVSRQLLQQYEEISAEFESRAIEPLLEGVDNYGPTFPPTCTLSRSRDNSCKVRRIWRTWNIDNEMGSSSNKYTNGQYHQSCFMNPTNEFDAFGWCDRIFYNTYNGKNKLKCIYYDSVDVIPEKLSNNRPVMAILEL